MIEFLPGEIDGWEKSGKVDSYTPGNLYRYINGGAELFISYGFKSMWAVTYNRPENPGATINLDVFDMGTPGDAFGVFAQGCEACDSEIGQGSQYSAGLLTFWKGRYYVSILSYPETEEKKKTIIELGRHLAGKIAPPGALPAIISMLPEKGLVNNSTRYFRHYVWLNSHFFVSNEDILLIRENSEAVLAKYRQGEDQYYLLLVLYPTLRRAESGLKSFLDNYLPNARDGIMEKEDSRWTGCTRKGNLVTVVFRAGSRRLVGNLLSASYASQK